MFRCCYKKGCEHEAQYVCLCFCCETYSCEFHLEAHLKLGFRTHAFDSILTEPSEWTKLGILEFLTKEKLSKEKLKKIGVASCNKNCNNLIEESLRDVESDLGKINGLIEMFSQASEKEDETVLNQSILMFNTESAISILPEPYRSVMVFCKSVQLRNKKWSLLNRANNDIETEQDFRTTCALYENFASEPLLSQVYQEYINAYHKLTSLYNVRNEELFIYNTESETEEMHILDFKKSSQNYKTSSIQFYSGDLFFILNGTLFRIDRNYRVCEMPAPIKMYYEVFYKKSIYYFGGDYSYNVSWRFDLDDNKWTKIASNTFSRHIDISSSIVYKNNIITSGKHYCYLLLYSIDIESFSEIPYKFADLRASKILLNIGDRLYIIIWNDHNKLEIYESEEGNAYFWNQIAFKNIASGGNYYCSYNKGGVYISSFNKLGDSFSSIDWKSARNYFKFDLNTKRFFDIACYRNHLALKQLENKFEVIDCYGQSFKLDSDLAESYFDKGYKIAILANQLEEIECNSMSIIEHECNKKQIYSSNDIRKDDDNIKNGYYYYQKSYSLSSIGRYLESIDCYITAFKLRPVIPRDLYFSILANNLTALGRYTEAIEHYNEAIKLEPSDLMVYLKYKRKGICFHERGMYLEAIESYDKAIEFKTQRNHESYFRKGYALYNLGRNIEALEYYNKSYEENPDNDYYYYHHLFNRAITLNDLGQEAEAQKDFNKAYEMYKRYKNEYNGILEEHNLELLRVFANLQEHIIDIKDKFEKIKDEGLELEVIKEIEMKWQAFKIEQSKLLNKASKCLDEYKEKSIKAVKQIKKEVDELQCALVNIIDQ